MAAALASPTMDGLPERVRLYYGLPGSADYVLGTVPASVPTDAWALHSEMGTGNSMMDNAACASATHTYALSGYNPAHPRVLLSCANGATSWTTLAQPPQELANGGAAVVGDTLYYCSGYSYATSTTVDTLWKYSISGNSWTGAPGPFTGTSYNWSPFVLACLGRVYYISGCNQPGATSPTTDVWAYTPGAGWAQVGSMNQGRVFAAGFVYHDTIWMAGGNADNVGVTHTEFYDPVSDIWTVNNGVFPQLPYALWGPGSGIAGGTGFAAGGAVGAALSDSVLHFDFASRTWSVDYPLVAPVYRTSGVGTADGKALLVGGSTGGYVTTDTVQYELVSSGNGDDVGVTAILAPGSIVTPGSIQPRVRIKNFGTNPQSNIPVYITIDSAATSVYLAGADYAGPLAPGATADVSFSPNWDAVGGTYDVTGWTELAGDQVPANDTMAREAVVMQYTVSWSQSDTIEPDRVSRTACVVTSDGRVHVVCGNCFPHVSHPNVMSYDPVSRAWTESPVSHPAGGGVGVHNHDAVAINDTIYCGGGSSDTTGFYNNISIYSPNDNTWTAGAAMPQADLSYYTFETDGRFVYLFGGVTSATIADAHKYDPVTNTWSPIADMPAARRNVMTACIGDTIYVIGGMSGNDHTSTRGTVWKYSIAGDNWVDAGRDSLPDRLGWGRAVSFGDGAFERHIYVVGGYRAGTVTNACWRYDVQSGTWTADRPLLINTRSHGMDIAGDVIWVAGGYNNVILPNMIRGEITPPGLAEGRPSLRWTPAATSPTFIRDLGRISYTVPRAGRVDLSVYDVGGRLVRTLESGAVEAGERITTWDRTDSRGSPVANGTYFYRLTVDGTTVSRKAILLD